MSPQRLGTGARAAAAPAQWDCQWARTAQGPGQRHDGPLATPVRQGCGALSSAQQGCQRACSCAELPSLHSIRGTAQAVVASSSTHCSQGGGPASSTAAVCSCPGRVQSQVTALSLLPAACRRWNLGQGRCWTLARWTLSRRPRLGTRSRCGLWGVLGLRGRWLRMHAWHLLCTGPAHASSAAHGGLLEQLTA